MQTFELKDYYDSQFIDGAPNGDDYSNFLGINLANIFPSHTVLGKALGSTNDSKGIELSGLINYALGGTGGGSKKKKTKPKPKPKPLKKDNSKKYMMIGGGVLLLVIIIILFVVMRKK